MTPHLARLLVGITVDILRSLAIAVGIVLITFFLIRMIPGDVVDVRGLEGSLTYAQQSAMRDDLGLSRGWIEQFFTWLSMISTGDLGVSSRFATPIVDLIATVLPSTLKLGLAALGIGLFFGIALPTLACVYPRSIFVGLVDFVTIWSITIPTFSIGILCVVVFAVWLGWIPAIGNFVVPAIILGMDIAGTIAKMLHEDMKDIEGADYIRTARAKGLSPARIVIGHILPNAFTIVIALAGLILAGVLTGALTMEVVFGLPGLGTLTLQAIKGRDYPVVQAVIIWLGLAVIFANLLTDLLQRFIDPRLRKS
ncbi:ABC transporter permease [Microvirga brassicacearum]|uniref:ABC transporter permease n=1 Tax=Microvirga brassicacearum TaxID=2580413 RepID=A0A5N3PE80_9HYPH|nr:ABC transporter permease [Microvirga brassicacearum]KAB0268013.1 ABC transporter permease [Microvirga brassicacearum]